MKLGVDAYLSKVAEMGNLQEELFILIEGNKDLPLRLKLKIRGCQKCKGSVILTTIDIFNLFTYCPKELKTALWIRALMDFPDPLTREGINFWSQVKLPPGRAYNSQLSLNVQHLSRSSGHHAVLYNTIASVVMGHLGDIYQVHI